MGTLNNRCRIINRDPKRDHNFDNHPYAGKMGQIGSLGSFGVSLAQVSEEAWSSMKPSPNGFQ